MDLETFFGSLYALTARQWRVILALLVCANLIVYGAVAWLWWIHVYRAPPPPEPPVKPPPAPTLRPTYTPTWTPAALETRTPARTPAP